MHHSFARSLALVLISFGILGFASPLAWADLAEAWGDNGSGQLGNGNNTNSNAPVRVNVLSSSVTAITDGQADSVALQGGAVYIWGFGALNTKTMNANSNVPVAVASLSSGVTAVASGAAHQLAIQNGGIYAWGFNGYGELGDGTNTSSVTPVAVSGMSTGVTAIAGGINHSLAIKGGGVYAWGYNGDGELGNGTYSNSYTPVAVTGLSTGVTAIAAGNSTNMAIQGGGLYAWGSNSDYQMSSDGSVSSYNTPVAVSGLSSGVTAIAAGGNHCMTVKGGAVYAWGDNYNGQLGIGTTKLLSNVPVQVDPTDLTSIVAVAASYESSYALSSDGSLWVWGDNTYGELGLGTTTTEYATPQHLFAPSGYKFTSIDADADSDHAVATIAAAPEPGSVASLAFGMIALLRRR